MKTLFLPAICFFFFIGIFSSQKSWCAIANDTDGSCTADSSPEDGTCSSSSSTTAAALTNVADDVDETTNGQICFPDGNCFSSEEDAAAKYRTSLDSYVKLDIDGRSVNYGDDQQVAGSHWKSTMDVIMKTNEYMAKVFQNDTAKSYRNECKARHEQCAFWAASGECEKNPKYMLLHCAPMCETCHEISFEHRCPYDKDAPTIWKPGDLNAMFERITTDDYYIDKYQPNVLSKDPWIVTLENVATEEECKQMIQLGANRGYERSKDVGAK